MEENNKHVQPNSKEEGVQRLNRILSESTMRLPKTKAMDWSSSTESETCFSTSTMRENRSRSSTR